MLSSVSMHQHQAVALANPRFTVACCSRHHGVLDSSRRASAAIVCDFFLMLSCHGCKTLEILQCTAASNAAKVVNLSQLDAPSEKCV